MTRFPEPPDGVLAVAVCGPDGWAIAEREKPGDMLWLRGFDTNWITWAALTRRASRVLLASPWPSLPDQLDLEEAS